MLVSRLAEIKLKQKICFILANCQCFVSVLFELHDSFAVVKSRTTCCSNPQRFCLSLVKSENVGRFNTKY